MPQPGLSLLRLAQGRVEAAAAAIRVAAKEGHGPIGRATVLAAFIEIMLASGDTAEARSASAELNEIAEQHGASLLAAISNAALGAILLAEGEKQGAVSLLLRARNTWSDLELPYEAARARLLLAIACHRLGDNGTSEMELAAARQVFTDLGATTDIERLRALSPKVEASSNGSLSTREVQVLKQIASGATNREIAEKLGISEKTVARHKSNIFVKLDLNTRAAATAYAFRNALE